ncbi:restriction endonuclease subunit S [Candidatus Poribacteria bacterium]|nr:restriction endonuclease subunit S [Candidatus Poribacteria bacterium]
MSTITNQFPPEWQLMRVGDLFQATAGGDYDPSRSNDVQDDRYPYPIYANGLEQQGLYGFSNYAEAQAGSITVTGRGALGNAFYRDTPFVAIGRLIVLKPKFSLDARFFCEYINYRIEFAVESTGVPQLTAPQISNYLLPVPPEHEQRAIAEVLSDVDRLLNALEALIAKKRAIKQATMQQLLTGKTRLSGFSGKWQEMRIGDLFDAKAGGDLVQSRYSDVQDNRYPYPIYANGLEQQGLYGFSDYAEEPAGLITVTARGTLGQAFYRDTPFVAIGRLLVLKPKVSLDARFFCESINHGTHFAVESTGVPQLTAPQISHYLLPVPSESEQHAIASVLSDMDAEITALEQRRDKTIAIKQGMMQQLLTGRVRLSESPIIADDTD